MTTIPVSTIVNVTPNVLAAGGNALDLVGMLLSNSSRVPIGTIQSFPDPDTVSDYFGASSVEAALAAIYFNGFDNSRVKPGAVRFAQYNQDVVSAYLRGGDISSLTLAQLQALSGSLVIVMDGDTRTAPSVNLSAATSFSNAATIISTALPNPTEASVTGLAGGTFTGSIATTVLTVSAVIGGAIRVGDTISGTGVTVGTTVTSFGTGTGGTGTYNISVSQTVSSTTITATSTTLNVTAVSTGALAVGQTVTGSGVSPGTIISAFGTGTGGTGTYIVSIKQQFASTALTVTSTPVTVTYDSVSGAFVFTSGLTGALSTAAFATGTLSASFKLTSATGAVISQGAAAAAPYAFMTSLSQVSQNWVTFMTCFNPDISGNANKLEFARWANGQNKRFMYAGWDGDAAPTTTVPASSSLGQLIDAADYSGTCVIYDTSANGDLAAFLAGAVASIDFTQTNGRATLAFRSQTGITASVTDAAVVANLEANHYNYYGAFGSADENFTFFYPGRVSGPFEWVDSYINEIWLNSNFELAMILLLTNSFSIPYNAAGRATIEAGLADPINNGVNFGAIRQGVALSSTQITAVNTEAGVRISDTLATRGWYAQVRDADAATRQARGSPPITVWYMDGQAVQKIDLASIELQ